MEPTKIDGIYENFAFISYTEENTEKAQWLKKKLTHYKFPVDIREERKDLPSWIRPVFEWKTDTSGGYLKGKDSQIQNALFNSKYLIVICSPQAVKSEPVNGEIQDFIKWGREKYIIPFIIGGQPHAKNPEEECFPPALLELKGDRERKGIFIDNISEDFAFLSVISTMFKINVNDLWKPYEREKREKRRLIYGILFLIFLITFFLVLFFRHQNRQLQMSRSRFIAEKAEQLIAEGDSYLAQLLLLEVLPDGPFDDKPFAIEAELALRKAIKESTRKLPLSDIACNDLGLSIGDEYVIGITETDTAYVWRTDNAQLYKKIYLKDYPDIDYDELPDGYGGIYFLSETQFLYFYNDSLAHVWDLETGKMVRDIAIYQLPIRTTDDAQFREDNMPLHVWDSIPSRQERIIQKSDGHLYVINSKNVVLEKIDIANPLFAKFSLNTDEIFVITENELYTWSRKEHGICGKYPCPNDYPYGSSSSWERASIYFNKDMTKFVMNNVMRGGHYDLVENWVLYDLTSYEDSPLIVSYAPILFSSNGKMCIYDKGDLKMGKTDYCIMDFAQDYEDEYDGRIAINSSCEEDWEHIRKIGEFVIDEDTLVFLEGKTLSDINNKAIYNDFVESYKKEHSSTGFFESKYDDNETKIYIYGKDSKLIKTLDYHLFGNIYTIRISPDGKYLLSEHGSKNDGDDGKYYYLWDIDKSSNELFKHLDHEYMDFQFSIDGRTLISSLGDVYDIKRKKYRHLNNPMRYADKVSVSNNGEYYAICDGHEVALWKSSDLERKWTFTYNDPYSEMGRPLFSPNSKELLVGHRYGVFIFDSETGKMIDQVPSYENRDYFYSSNGKHIYALDRVGCIKHDRLPLEDIIKISKNKLKGRKLTDMERMKYHLQ